MCRIVITALFFLATAALAEPALAQKRIALVVGNSDYTKIAKLKNPRNDARLIAATLKSVGFEVALSLDADRLTLGRAIRKFGNTLREAGPKTVGLFYYAGHGVQHRGQNYLIPLNAHVEFSADLEIEAFRLQDVLSQMASAGNALNIAILDACRNNPFPTSTRSTARGLARVATFNESLIAFAAAPGQVALDGDGTNSPYTTAFVKAVRTPGLSVEEVFKQTRLGVLSATDGTQTPWEQSSLTGDFSFTNAPAAKTPEGQPKVQTESPAEHDNTQIELTFWNSVKDSGDAALIQAYLDQYPNGRFNIIATLMIERLKEKRAPEAAKQREKKLAAVDRKSEPAQKPKVSATLEPDDPDLPRHIQSALTDVGCDPGVIDGKWGRKSQKALESFARYANVRLPDDALSLETLKLLEQHDARVCPLQCGPRQIEQGGRCIAKTCAAGQVLTNSGQCVVAVQNKPRVTTQQRRPTQTAPRKKGSGPWCTETERRLHNC